eukprot:5854342-Pleurochrysis_carterae.AAC.2
MSPAPDHAWRVRERAHSGAQGYAGVRRGTQGYAGVRRYRRAQMPMTVAIARAQRPACVITYAPSAT